MGSGFIMNAAAFKAITEQSPEKVKEILEALGILFLTDVFSSNDIEDFEASSEKAATLVKGAVEESFKREFGSNYPFSVDVVPIKGRFKISFFK